MGPYRTSHPPEAETPPIALDDGRKLAFAVLLFVGGVQVTLPLSHPGLSSAQTVFGAVCFLAGLVGLFRG